MHTPPSRFFLICLLLGAFVSTSQAADSTGSAEPISITFESLSAERGLLMSIVVRGDDDGETTLGIKPCCGIENANGFVRDVRIGAGDRPLAVDAVDTGWTVRHAPRETLKVSYRLPPTGPMQIDGGLPEQMRPLVHAGRFHLIGRKALLLPTGRPEEDRVTARIDASAVADEGRFVSSFGSQVVLDGVETTRRQLVSALYLGGEISLSRHDTPFGQLGIVHSGMDPGVPADAIRADALAIVDSARSFFNDGQPWYLISVHGGRPNNPNVKLGGGVGLTHAFAMFVDSALDFSGAEREMFRWVLAHEYFHEWNGLTVRVAPKPGSEDDDTSVYWFSEGVTDFFTMRLLTRAGLQSPKRSLDVLNNRLQRYARNSRRGVSAEEAGALFWTDRDGEQIPYLRGYLVAWHADLAMRRSSDHSRDLDSVMKALVQRARAEPGFRVDNTFLASHLGQGLSPGDRRRLHAFMLEGGEAPFDTDSFAPCLTGAPRSISGIETMQFEFATPHQAGCFQH